MKSINPFGKHHCISCFPIFILLFFGSLMLSGQSSNLYFEAEFNAKFSIGETKRKTIQYKPGSNVNYPIVSKYDLPVLGVNFSINKRLFKQVSVGVATGANFAFNEKDPLSGRQIYTKAMIPFFAKASYYFQISKMFNFKLEANIGYQFINRKFGELEGVTVSQENGGLLAGLNLGIKKRIGNKLIYLKAGYEINESNIKFLVEWDEPSENGKIRYITKYNLLNISTGIRF